MLSISHRYLKLLAAAVWISGGFVLTVKSIGFFLSTHRLQPDLLAIGLAAAIGLAIGIAKVIYIFRHSCRRNLQRIEGLTNPQIWQVFRPGFLVFMALMIVLGSLLSNYAVGKYGWSILMAVIDMSLAIALLGSSHVFWRRPAQE